MYRIIFCFPFLIMVLFAGWPKRLSLPTDTRAVLGWTLRMKASELDVSLPWCPILMTSD